MKPIYNKTALENMIALVKASNPDVEITPDQLTLTTPVTNPDTNLTTLKLVAKEDQGYSGEVDVTYVRRKLELDVRESTYLMENPFVDLETVVDELAQTLGLVKSEISTTLVAPSTFPAHFRGISVRVGSIEGVIYDGVVSKVININPPPRTYDLTISSATAVAGDQITIDLIATKIPANVILPLYANGISPADISQTTNKIEMVMVDGVGSHILTIDPELDTNRGMTIYIGEAYKTIVTCNLIARPHVGVVGVFYHGKTSRISDLGKIIGEEVYLGTSRNGLGGASYSSTLGIFYGGSPSGSVATRISDTLTLIGSETTVADARYYNAGIGYTSTLGLFFGGFPYANRIIRISNLGTQVGTHTVAGTDRHSPAGASYTATLGIFYGGQYTANTNTATRISNLGTLVGSETQVGTARHGLAGADYSETLAIFYGGNNTTTYNNTATRISNTGTLVGSETQIGTARAYLAGAGYSTTLGIFYAGLSSSATTNTITRVSNTGTLLNPETTTASGRRYLAGAGYR